MIQAIISTHPWPLSHCQGSFTLNTHLTIIYAVKYFMAVGRIFKGGGSVCKPHPLKTMPIIRKLTGTHT